MTLKCRPGVYNPGKAGCGIEIEDQSSTGLRRMCVMSGGGACDDETSAEED